MGSRIAAFGGDAASRSEGGREELLGPRFRSLRRLKGLRVYGFLGPKTIPYKAILSLRVLFWEVFRVSGFIRALGFDSV